jgi:putative transposase
MTVLSERRTILEDIEEARREGARLEAACEVVGIHMRTYRRWTQGGAVKADGRPVGVRPSPSHRLSDAERSDVLRVCNEPRFASLPPSQIVPRLADEGVYLASESSFYRLLHAADQQQHRGRAEAPIRKAPTSHEATGPNQVWCWDITYLPSGIRGLYFYLYLILDLYSRKIVGWEVQATESGEQAATLLRRTALSEAIQTWRAPLVLHADNGSPMKSATLLATLQWLGVTPSHSRPRVSNDNAYAESVFRTCKYRPEYPGEGFATLDEARAWVLRFVAWYNTEHRHSGLNFVTPEQRHTAQAQDIMKQRIAVYEAARARHPQRWSGAIRNWSLPASVWLNPEKAASTQAQAA